MDSSSYASATGRVRLQSRTHSHCMSYKTGGSHLEAGWAVVAPKDCQWFANHFGSSGCRLVLQSSCADYVTRHGPRITVGLTHRLGHSPATSTVQLYMRAWHSRHSALPGLNMGAEQAGDHLGKSRSIPSRQVGSLSDRLQPASQPQNRPLLGLGSQERALLP